MFYTGFTGRLSPQMHIYDYSTRVKRWGVKFFCNKHVTLGENAKSISYWYSNTGTVGYWSRFHQKWTIPYEVDLYVNCCLWSPPTHPSNVDHQNFHKLNHLCLLLLLSPNDIELQEDWWKILIWKKRTFCKNGVKQLHRRGEAVCKVCCTFYRSIQWKCRCVSFCLIPPRSKRKAKRNDKHNGSLWLSLVRPLSLSLVRSGSLWLYLALILSRDLITKALLLLSK